MVSVDANGNTSSNLGQVYSRCFPLDYDMFENTWDNKIFKCILNHEGIAYYLETLSG